MTQLDASARNITVAALALTEAIDRGEHPTRVGDYIRDVERWCQHAHGNLATWSREVRYSGWLSPARDER